MHFMFLFPQHLGSKKHLEKINRNRRGRSDSTSPSVHSSEEGEDEGGSAGDREVIVPSKSFLLAKPKPFLRGKGHKRALLGTPNLVVQDPLTTSDQVSIVENGFI